MRALATRPDPQRETTQAGYTTGMESLIAFVFSLLIGGVAFFSGLNILRAGRRVERWPTVAGTVVERDVVLSTVGAVSTPGSRYRARVRYTYVVDGVTYEGDKILAVGGFTGSREAMQREIDRFDGPVEVRYNPENPAEACLKSVPSWWAIAAFGGAALAILVGLVQLVTMRSPG